MKKHRQLVLIAAATLLLALTSGAQAAMYVEGFLGGTTACNLGSDSPRVIGGGRLGYWFVPEGVLGLNYPNWMQHVGFYTDISGHWVNIDRGSIHENAGVATWAFMAVGRCGFIKDDEVPFGRLQPYVGLGLADMVISTSDTSRATVALVVDAGVRYMLNKRFSVDLFFRYRHAQPDLTYNLFSGMAGLAYHF